MKIEVNKDKGVFYIGLFVFPVFILAELLHLLSDNVNWDVGYAVLFGIAIALWLYILLAASAKYTLDSEGFHFHYFIFTFNFSWDSFSDIYIKPFITDGVHYGKIICFNRRLKLHSPRFSQVLHPFRYFVIALEEEGKPINKSFAGRVVKKSEIIRFLKNNHLPFTVRNY